MAETRTYHVSKTFNAPIRYVYDWCTDFREDDNKLAGKTWRRHILEKTKSRAVYISHWQEEGKEDEGVRLVTLKPPKAWHLDGVTEGEHEVGEYRLSSVGKNKTRLNMTFKVTYKRGEPESKESWEGDTSETWDRFKAALENDYSSGRSSTA
jgi:hypothetical protein